MKTEEIVKEIKKLQFTDYSFFGSQQLSFNPQFRYYCAENYCGQYGANYSCPPFCGSPADMEKRVLRYKNGILLTQKCYVSDFSQKEIIESTRKKLSEKTMDLAEKLKAQNVDCLMIGAGGCEICERCKMKDNEPCPFEECRFSCMSAYCINVKDIATKCRMIYDYDGETLFMFSAIMF